VDIVVAGDEFDLMEFRAFDPLLQPETAGNIVLADPVNPAETHFNHE
jgi:hypothetical protein